MQALSLDAAETLFDLAEPVDKVYVRFAKKHGYQLPLDGLAKRFKTAFETLEAPDYPNFDNGHLCETAWWREVVLRVTSFPDDKNFEAFFQDLFGFYATPNAWTLFPDTLPFLETVAQKYRLLALSNFDARLHTIMDGLELTPYFEAIVSSADARARKPSIRIFEFAGKKLSLPLEQILHIGDSYQADYEGAIKAGMKAFHLQRKKGQTLLGIELQNIANQGNH